MGDKENKVLGKNLIEGKVFGEVVVNFFAGIHHHSHDAKKQGDK
jgi:hypothetical protein